MARKAKLSVEVVDAVETEVVDAVETEVVDAVETEVVEPVSEVSQLVSQLISVESVNTEVVKTDDKNVGVGIFIRKLITEGLGNKAILDIVHEQYGNKNTTYACVAWYRNKMKKTGQVVAKSNNIDWIQNFAKVNGLSEESVSELMLKVG